MTSFRTRPRFKHFTELTFYDINERIEKYINHAKENGFNLKMYTGYFSIDIAIKDRHFWSPHLNVNIDPTENGYILRGRFGPSPSIWTVFLFGYVSLGLLVAFICMYGFSMLALGYDAQILWLLPILVGLILGLWTAGQVGQKLGVEQTFRILHYVEVVFGEQLELH